MFDLISISARNEEQLMPSLLNFLEVSNKVILARHPNANLLKYCSQNLIQFNGSLAYISRLYEALQFVSSDFVLLSADDDFYIPSSVQSIAEHVNLTSNVSCISGITSCLTQYTQESIHIAPYLVSSEIIKKKSFSSPTSLYNSISARYFQPLCVDFYSLYNTSKLRLVLDLFVHKIRATTLDQIGTSMKLFQYLYSYALALVGDILPVSLPLYVRGKEVPLRKQRAYTSSLIQASELVSFNSEVQNFLADKSSWADFIQCLYLLIQENKSIDLINNVGSPDDLSDTLKNTLIQCVSLSKIDFVDLTVPKYELHVSRNTDKALILRQQNKLIVKLSLNQLTGECIPKFIGSPFQPFLLDSQYCLHLRSCIESLWRPFE